VPCHPPYIAARTLRANVGSERKSTVRLFPGSSRWLSVDYVNLKLLAVRCEASTPVNVTVSFAS
jgi:hypothetical protein